MAEIRNLTRNGETFYPLTHENAVIGMEDFKETITEQIENYRPIEITGDVVNAPDEEDITSDSNNLLKFKDRNNLYGLGKVILRRGSSFASQVTQANTIYVIQYNFDLDSGRVNIPNGSILLFEGGSLSNGTLVCADLYDVRLVYYQDVTEILSSVILEGNFIYKACDKDTTGSISVDNSSIEMNASNQLTVKANGIQNTHLNGSVVNTDDLALDSNNKIKLANRGTTDGMGYVILRKEVSFESQVTQGNTIYEIRYDFTLTQNHTIPDGCTLKFNGGSISGAYTITGNNTDINAGLVKIFNTDITLAGTWNVAEAYPEWFGAKGDGVTDDSSAFNKCQDFGKTVKLSDKNYLVEDIITFKVNCIGVYNSKIIVKNTYLRVALVVSHEHHIVFKNIIFEQSNDTEYIFGKYIQCISFENCEFKDMIDVFNSREHNEWMGVLYFKKCDFKNISGSILNASADINHVTFDNSRITNVYNIFTGKRIFEISIHDCDIEDTNIINDSIGISNTFFNFNISNCYIEGVRKDNDSDTDAALFRISSSRPTGNIIIDNCYIGENGAYVINFTTPSSYQWEIGPVQFTFNNCSIADLKGNATTLFNISNAGDNYPVVNLCYSEIYQYDSQYSVLNAVADIVSYCNLPKCIKYKIRRWDWQRNRWENLNNDLDAFPNAPTTNYPIPIGYHYFNTTSNKVLYYTGSGWVDATGTSV